jgi:hypothetical protein
MDRLRATLGGVDADDLGGDNLAILLASHFEPQIEDEELDDSETWKQGAIDATNRVLDAIHAHYASSLAAANAEIERLRAENKRISGDHAVHLAELMAACSEQRNRVRDLRARCDHFEGDKIAAEASVATLTARVAELEADRAAIVAWIDASGAERFPTPPDAVFDLNQTEIWRLAMDDLSTWLVEDIRNGSYRALLQKDKNHG